MTVAREELIRITERARAQIESVLATEQPEEGFGLRLGVVGGGCSGFTYEMELSPRRPHDNVVPCGSFEIYLDPKSTIYLRGITLDFQDGLGGRGFVFSNPNAVNTCGCGDSFTL